PTPNPTACTGTGSEIVHITPVTPTQLTSQSSDGPIGSTTISDTDTVSGAFGAAGSSDKVSFRLYGPFATLAAVSCSGTPVYSELGDALSGGTAGQTKQTWSASTTATTPGAAGFHPCRATGHATGHR